MGQDVEISGHYYLTPKFSGLVPCAGVPFEWGGGSFFVETSDEINRQLLMATKNYKFKPIVVTFIASKVSREESGYGGFINVTKLVSHSSGIRCPKT